MPRHEPAEPMLSWDLQLWKSARAEYPMYGAGLAWPSLSRRSSTSSIDADVGNRSRGLSNAKAAARAEWPPVLASTKEIIMGMSWSHVLIVVLVSVLLFGKKTVSEFMGDVAQRP